MGSQTGPSAERRLVLCFDGTGNTFRADGTETNILKLFRMLDRFQDDQICYYQPGIGTDITPGSLANTAFRRGKRLWTNKVLDLALGQSFEQHLIGGYRFLMRHYRSGCKMYIFGFSRGAYTARFLNEMLDFVGLLGADNEEMIPFVWQAFATWKLGNPKHKEERRTAYNFLKVCRETVCRPVGRVQFLGLFDAVNSIAKFQVDTEGIPHSRFIRHAVSIDERRVKFQPVLFRPAMHQPRPRPSPADPEQLVHDDSELGTDIQEVWFPGGHADIGGGWKLGEGEEWPLSHAPLVWMVQEAQRAGLRFESARLCQGQCLIEREESDQSKYDRAPLEALRLSATKGLIHDRLKFGQGLPLTSVLLWRLMEYLPLARMNLRPDGSWILVHLPLPCGEVRDIPQDAEIHVSAIRRMQFDSQYRPGNLVVGGTNGRGVRRSPKEYGIGEWVVSTHEGDPVLETYRRAGTNLTE
ncbi:Uncharacterized alpha/beta hydrolase domain (DUF2235) domain containing protein [Naviculisporaceae sp. PSN 640]